MSRATLLTNRILELLGDLGKIPEPMFAYVHVQSDTAKRLDMARQDRVKKRRKKRKNKNEAVNKEKFSSNMIVHHGTSKDFHSFSDTAERNPTTPTREIKGHFFTSDAQSAASYASRSRRTHGGQARVIKATLHMTNPKDVTSTIKKHHKAGMTFGDAKNKAYTEVDRSKHDGVVFNGDSVNHSEYVAFHSHHIKTV